MKIYIKNMVCDRCIYVIASLLDEMQLSPVSVSLGEVDFGESHLSEDQLIELRLKCESLGFELIDDKKARIIDRVKTSIIDLLHQQLAGNVDLLENLKLSDYLKQKIHYDYSHISQLFSAIENITIEHYFILQKIERAKELLVYDEITTTEIANRLGYSSLAHLSGQFKKVTGMTPSQFKKNKKQLARKTLDKV